MLLDPRKQEVAGFAHATGEHNSRGVECVLCIHTTDSQVVTGFIPDLEREFIAVLSRRIVRLAEEN